MQQANALSSCNTSLGVACSKFMQEVKRQLAGVINWPVVRLACICLHRTKQTAAGVQLELRKHDQTIAKLEHLQRHVSFCQPDSHNYMARRNRHATARCSQSSCAYSKHAFV